MTLGEIIIKTITDNNVISAITSSIFIILFIIFTLFIKNQ